MGQSAYAVARIDIEAGDRTVKLMKASVARTRRPEVLGGLGSFAGFFDASALKGYAHPVLTTSTNGVGTEVATAQALNHHDTIGFDLVGVLVDDLVVCGVGPLFVADYIACGRVILERIAAIISDTVDAYVAAGYSLVGGETAEHPGLLGPDEYNVADAATGITERDTVLGADRVETGDVVLAMASSRLHSNGYSLTRHVLLEQAGQRLNRYIDELGRSLGEKLLTSTRIYALDVLALIREAECHTFGHIASGGLTNDLTCVTPADRKARLKRDSWNPPVIFRLVQQVGRVSQADIETTLNMGVGMVAILSETGVDAAVALLGSRGIDAWVLGHIETHDGPSATELV